MKIFNTQIRKASSATRVEFQTLNAQVVDVEYAIRGPINTRAMELKNQILTDNNLPFDKIISCNIGNPQVLEQKPLSFVRDVCSLAMNPTLIDRSSTIFKSDVIERAQKHLNATPSLGCYTESKGLPSVREEICDFLETRDGIRGDMDDIFLTNGASDGAKLLLTTFMRHPTSGFKDGLLAPVPQYPIYSALMTLLSGECCGYYLDENNGWSIDSNSIDVALKKAEADGTTIRAIVVINPGNPTGQVLSSDALKDIITYCKDKNICVIADEVYQENVYKEGKKFTSFRKVAYEMNAFDGTNPLQLVSLHSTSKGFFGECGLRGGYFELLGFSQEVRDTVYKLASLTLCSNTIGQIATGVMVNPPKQGDPSYDTYTTERSAILESLQRRATKLSHALDQLEGVSCNSADGAMYCFPSIVLPEGAHIAAKERGCAVDEMYCFELLEATGIITVAGTGFSQVPGTFHVRFTILPPEDQIATLIDSITTFHASFLKKYH